MIPHNRVTTTEDDIRVVERVIRSGQLAQGSEVEALEAEFCAYTGRKYAVAVASGTAAIRLALLCCRNLVPTVPAYSCVALANAAYSFSERLGIADVLMEDWTIDPEDLGATPRESAVVAVNTFGAPANIAGIRAAAAGLVIEDCTHGFGAHKSDIEILSFHATKLIGAAGGGIVLTDNKDYAEQVRDRRDYDDKPVSGTRLNDKMSDVQAALVRSKLARFEAEIVERYDIAWLYAKKLRTLAGAKRLLLPIERATYYRFAITVEDACRTRKELGVKGIRAEQPICWWPDSKDAFPVSAMAEQELLSLPFYPGLKAEEIDIVTKALEEVLG